MTIDLTDPRTSDPLTVAHPTDPRWQPGGQYFERFRDRFWSRYTVSESGCWLWTRSVTSRGYGSVSLRDGFRLAHQVAYELTTGQPIPSGAQINHTCDVRRCIRPDHLVLGDHKANMRDKAERGRAPSPAARLTPQQVTEIRARFGNGRGFRPGERAELAREFGVSGSTIFRAVSGRSWR